MSTLPAIMKSRIDFDIEITPCSRLLRNRDAAE